MDDEKGYESDAEIKEEKDVSSLTSAKEPPVNDSLSSYATAEESLTPVVTSKSAPIEDRVPIVSPSSEIRSSSPITTQIEINTSGALFSLNIFFCFRFVFS